MDNNNKKANEEKQILYHITVPQSSHFDKIKILPNTVRPEQQKNFTGHLVFKDSEAANQAYKALINTIISLGKDGYIFQHLTEESKELIEELEKKCNN